MVIPFPNPSARHDALDHLRQEINVLAQEQNKALEKAAYVGMTKAEQTQYDERHEKLVELLRRLSVLDPPR